MGYVFSIKCTEMEEFNMDFYEKRDNRNYGVYVDNNAFQKDLSKVFGWLFLGLMLSAVAAYLGASLFFSHISTSGVFACSLVEIALVIFLTARINKMSHSTAVASFIGYSLLNGVTLSSIFFVYNMGSIVTAFLLSAIFFGFMALYGLTTNKDLSSLGTMFFVGLIAIIAVSILNIFIKSSGFELFIAYAGVAVFVGLTAYDMQKIKYMYQTNSGAINQNMSILAALTLYLDFINLFLRVLTIVGKKDD